jgi:putative hydrolase of HD superfamily
MNASPLEQQLAFLLELDRLKSVRRRSYLAHEDRRENAAEHSWHVALMAVVLAGHANEAVDVCRTVMMLLVHDIVEIDAGDTFAYDPQAHATRSQREQAAADRLFGLLPEPQRGRLRALWEEFERGDSAEARFARAVDRLMPMLHNIYGGGRSWREHGVSLQQVLEYNAPINDGSRRLWAWAETAARKAFTNTDETGPR